LSASSIINVGKSWFDLGELYFLDQKILSAVEVHTDAQAFSASAPRPLFNVNIQDNERRNRFLVTRDGQRFLVIVKDNQKPPPFSLAAGY